MSKSLSWENQSFLSCLENDWPCCRRATAPAEILSMTRLVLNRTHPLPKSAFTEGAGRGFLLDNVCLGTFPFFIRTVSCSFTSHTTTTPIVLILLADGLDYIPSFVRLLWGLFYLDSQNNFEKKRYPTWSRHPNSMVTLRIRGSLLLIFWV